MRDDERVGEQADERALVDGWRRGDEAAVRALFGITFPRAVRIAVLSGLTLDEAKDCAQETFVRAFERREQLRDPQAFPLWFHRILTRRVLDALGASSRGREEPLDEAGDPAEDWQRHESPQPDTLALAAELRAELWEYIQALPPHYRVPLVLRYYGDFSIREVAELVGAREGTVRVTLHRALAHLRTRMAHPPGSDQLTPSQTPAASSDRS